MGKERNETEVYSRNKGMKYRATYDSDNNVEYEGFAQNPAAAESDASWQICKHTFVDNNMTETNWASGSDDMDKAWTLRTTYSYT